MSREASSISSTGEEQTSDGEAVSATEAQPQATDDSGAVTPQVQIASPTPPPPKPRHNQIVRIDELIIKIIRGTG